MPKGLALTNTQEVERLYAAIAELNERVERLRQQDRDRQLLVRWLAKHPALTKKDVRAVADQMHRQGGFPAAALAASKSKPKGKGKGGGRMQPAQGVVGIAVRAARLKAGLTTTQLAAKMNTGSGHVSMIERGIAHPSEKVRARLAKALGIPATALANGDARP